MSERIAVKVGDKILYVHAVGTVTRIATNVKYPDDQDMSRFEVEFDGWFRKRREWVSAYMLHVVQP